METQCWICPICFDDHAQGKQCEPITHEQYNEICRQSNFDYQEFKRVEKDLTAAQAEIAELKELIKREVVPDIKDAEIARLKEENEELKNKLRLSEVLKLIDLSKQLQSALDVAVEGLGLVIADSSRPFGEIAGYFYSKETYDEVSSALDKIKQIRGEK